MRRWAGQLVLTAIVLMALVSAVTAQPPAAGAVEPTVATSGGSIQHVIVVMQSGHSFDNYFGTRPGVDGIPAGVCEPVALGSTSCVKPYHLSSEQARAGLSDASPVTKRAIDGGKMDGFVRAQPNSSIGSVAMGYLDGSDLPYYWSLADRFTLFDHFNASSQAGALPNRLVAIAGQDGGIESNTPPAQGIDIPNVFGQLNQAHLSWKYYVQGYQGPSKAPTAGELSRTPVLAMPSVTGTPANADRIVDTSQYFTDLTNGDLPAVSYVSSVDSEKSPQSPTLGEAFVQSLINALMQSSAWSHTILLVTYADSGGWYDHAVPPTVGGVPLGLRVPAILVSPYARPGYVDNEQADTASIPALIDHVFHLPSLSAQEDVAGSLLTGINLHQKPIAPAIDSRATILARPTVAIIYLLYLGALAITCLLIALAFRRGRRTIRPPSPKPVPEISA
jgi:phospholipase C